MGFLQASVLPAPAHRSITSHRSTGLELPHFAFQEEILANQVIKDSEPTNPIVKGSENTENSTLACSEINTSASSAVASDSNKLNVSKDSRSDSSTFGLSLFD